MNKTIRTTISVFNYINLYSYPLYDKFLTIEYFEIEMVISCAVVLVFLLERVSAYISKFPSLS